MNWDDIMFVKTSLNERNIFQSPPSASDIQSCINKWKFPEETLIMDYIPEQFTIEVYSRKDEQDCGYLQNAFKLSYANTESICIDSQALSFFLNLPIRNINSITLSVLLLLIIDPSKDHLEYLNRVLYQHGMRPYTDSPVVQYAIRQSLSHARNMSDKYYRASIETYSDVIEIMSSLIDEFINLNRRSKLIPIIETVDSQKILEYYSEHDIEKVPVLIELFNKYGKYEELTL